LSLRGPSALVREQDPLVLQNPMPHAQGVSRSTAELVLRSLMLALREGRD